jgi:hypothetical protein
VILGILFRRSFLWWFASILVALAIVRSVSIATLDKLGFKYHCPGLWQRMIGEIKLHSKPPGAVRPQKGFEALASLSPLPAIRDN